MMKSWTISFLREWTQRVTFSSAVRFRNYLVRERTGKTRAGGTIAIHMKRPFRGEIVLREKGSDAATFREIAVEEVYRTVVNKVAKFRTVIDLGANIGLASLYLAHHSPSCRILSIEPNPETYEMLVRNVRVLSVSGRCRTLRAAAWGTHRRLSPDPNVSKERFSTFRLRESEVNLQDEMIVEGLTMPEILDYSGFGVVDLLKIDIEGAEAELFRGRDLQWLSRVGSIAIEFHEDSRKTSKFDEIMKNCGFEISSEGDHTVLARKPDWAFSPQTKQS
jgi:FkbM family methyltransferase